MTTYRILVLDDDRRQKETLEVLTSLPQYHDVQIVGYTPRVDEIIDLIKTQIPDAIIVDMRLDGDYEGGLKAIRQIKETTPQARILAWSTVIDQPDFIRRVLCAGAGGYVLLLPSEWPEIFDAIRQVAEGLPVIPPNAMKTILEGPRKEECLTEREQQVWRLIAEGLTNREIALELSMTLDVVKRTASGLYSKIGVSSRAQATKEWLKQHAPYLDDYDPVT